MQEQINAGLLGSIKAKQDFAESCGKEICRLVETLVAAFRNGNKLLIFGNGGSAADAQHLAAEFVNRFLIDRRPLPAIALTTDSSILTSIGNDFSFADIFVKQIQALGQVGDVALGISTSGNSPNVVKAIEQASAMGLTTAVLTGGHGGKLLPLADIGLNVPCFFTPHIQEAHLWAEHLLCQLVDETMFGAACSMTSYQPLDFSALSTYSLHDRTSKVTVSDFAKVPVAGCTVRQLLDSLPRQLMGRDFPELVKRLADCHRRGRPIFIGMGAHVIKVGLNPVLIDLLQRGIISGLALNGACIVHDTEIAMVGRTSEDVDQVLGNGAFGAAKETGEFINEAIKRGAAAGQGIGAAVGDALLAGAFPHLEMSLLASARRLKVPVTVHVAMGTDIVHIHPSADGAAIGAGSHLDFRLFCGMIADLEGGAYLNLGSAVLLPEVFLKALTVVRNLGHDVQRFTTANFDFIRHYRTTTNVVNRPTAGGGKGYAITGHHELMIPLLAAALLDELAA